MAYGEIKKIREDIRDHSLNMDLLEMLLHSALDRKVLVTDRDMKFLSRVFCTEGLLKRSLERKLENIEEKVK